MERFEGRAKGGLKERVSLWMNRRTFFAAVMAPLLGRCTGEAVYAKEKPVEHSWVYRPTGRAADFRVGDRVAVEQRPRLVTSAHAVVAVEREGKLLQLAPPFGDAILLHDPVIRIEGCECTGRHKEPGACTMGDAFAATNCPVHGYLASHRRWANAGIPEEVRSAMLV